MLLLEGCELPLDGFLLRLEQDDLGALQLVLLPRLLQVVTQHQHLLLLADNTID